MSHRKGFPATPAKAPTTTLSPPGGSSHALPDPDRSSRAEAQPFLAVGPASHRDRLSRVWERPDATVRPGPKQHGAHPPGPGDALAATHTPHAVPSCGVPSVTLAPVPLSTHRVGPARGRPRSIRAGWPRPTQPHGGPLLADGLQGACAGPGRVEGREGPRPADSACGRRPGAHALVPITARPPLGSDPTATCTSLCSTEETGGKGTTCQGPAGRSREGRGLSARPARPLLGTHPGEGSRAQTAERSLTRALRAVGNEPTQPEVPPPGVGNCAAPPHSGSHCLIGTGV